MGELIGNIVLRSNRVKAAASRIRAAAAALVCLAATGCAVGVNSIDDALTTGSISMAEATPSIAVEPFAPDPDTDAGAMDRLIDEDTMRLAVTTADLQRLDDATLAWASEATGSSGAVTGITQTKLDGQTCRAFNASRNAYDGVSVYSGEVCLDPRSGWWTRSMNRLGSGAAAESALN